MPAIADTLFLQDSEVLDIAVTASSLHALPAVRILLAAASVRRQAEGGPARARWGFLKPLSIELDGARVQGRIEDAVGRIGEGSLRLGDGCGAGRQATLGAVPLPWAVDGPVVLSLSFRMGGDVVIEAAAARCVPGPQARFFEALAC